MAPPDAGCPLRGSHGDIKQATFLLGLGRRAGTYAGRMQPKTTSSGQARTRPGVRAAAEPAKNVYTAESGGQDSVLVLWYKSLILPVPVPENYTRL